MTDKITPFTFLKAINQTKETLFEDSLIGSEYNSFMVNIGLSYFPDTIFFANEMNQHHHIPNEMQFEFLRRTIKARSRYSKWHKKESFEDYQLVQDYYKYSHRKTLEALKVLSEDDINNIKKKMSKGGKL